MASEYIAGIAFILEGATEYQFYEAFLKYLCTRHPEYTLEYHRDAELFQPYCILTGPKGKVLIRMNAVGTITQIHNSAAWFNSISAELGRQAQWTVFLCYDTDAYNADVTKFYRDDWKTFREKLSKRKVKTIIDMAAAADIEDLMLQDLHGISVFMGRPEELTASDVPTGKKGAVKMKKLFVQERQRGMTNMFYHKGDRARDLIDCLDFERIMDAHIVPLEEIEKYCFYD